MRGGRNKFGPMYKRDRARKLQIARQRQLALQALRGSISGPDSALSQLSPSSYQQTYSNMHIKQEIQIPQVSKELLNLRQIMNLVNIVHTHSFCKNIWLHFRVK